MDIWRFQNKIISRLMLWALISILTGIWLRRSKNPELRGAGTQFFGWGIVNAIIAGAGGILGTKRKMRLSESEAQAIAVQETHNLSRLLWVNSALDSLYVIGGAMLMKNRGEGKESRFGQGLGIIVQGGFLLLFDLYHVLQLQSAAEIGRDKLPNE